MEEEHPRDRRNWLNKDAMVGTGLEHSVNGKKDSGAGCGCGASATR